MDHLRLRDANQGDHKTGENTMKMSQSAPQLGLDGFDVDENPKCLLNNFPLNGDCEV